MASKTYTAQEMREVAAIISRLHIVDRMTCGEYCASIKDKIRSILRQSADAMEREEREKKREKKYEFSVKEFGGYVQPLHDDSMSSSFLDGRAVGDENYVIVRREVGEWEEVKDA